MVKRDCCDEQIKSKTLRTPMIELLTGDSINSLYENSAQFYVWWMEYLSLNKPWLHKRGHKR